jgi:hypothetical protein
MLVMPAKAGIHVALERDAKMDARFRGHDGRKRYTLAALLKYPDATA